MIIERIVEVLTNLFAWLIEQFPAPDVPTWLADLPSAISIITAPAASLSVWFPVGLLSAVLAAWAISYGVAVTIRLTRMLVSLFTGGGGSVA